MFNRLLTGGEYPQGILDVLESTIGYLTLSVGFSSIEYAALRILSNLYFSFIENLAVSALGNAESASRTSVMLSDIVLALIDMGFNVSSLDELPRKRVYRGCKEPSTIGNLKDKGIVHSAVLGPGGICVIPRPLSLRSNSVASSMRHPNMSVNANAELFPNFNPPPAPAYISLPCLPEPHTFLDTKVKRAPFSTDPVSLRRHIFGQKRKVQESLIRFLSRIKSVKYVFPGDAESFVLITPKKSARPYLAALLADSSTSSELMENSSGGGGGGGGDQPKLAKFTSTNVTTPTTELMNPYLLKPKFPGY